MRGVLVLSIFCFVAFLSVNANAAGCYITPTNDYICDQQNPGSSGRTVQREGRRNIPGSNNVFTTGDVRSQYDWMAGVLGRLGTTVGSGGPVIDPGVDGDGDGTSETTIPPGAGGECEPGVDARAQFEVEIFADEGRRNCSYYDGIGNNCPYTGPGGPSGPPCSRGGCLTIGVGHLVRRGETQYTPCGTCISDEEVDRLKQQDIDAVWGPAISHADEACVSGDGCFIKAIANVLFQGGTNFLRGTFSNSWGHVRCGRYDQAIAGFNASAWARQTPSRVQQWTAAIAQVKARRDAGENVGCNC